MANSVDPDQTPRSVASDLGLHCFLSPVFLNTQNKYANLIKKISQKDCLWKQRTKMGVSVLLSLFISSNEVCNTAYAL